MSLEGELEKFGWMKSIARKTILVFLIVNMEDGVCMTVLIPKMLGLFAQVSFYPQKAEYHNFDIEN